MTKKKVVICGITGSQGRWVYDALKGEDEFELVGYSRNVERAKAKLGPQICSEIELLQGDSADLASLQKIFKGADYVFGMTQPWSADYSYVDVESEILQGKCIVQACLDCKVKHLVFSGAAHGEEKSGLPHVDSKIDIEQMIKTSGLNYTILMPVQFADNIGLSFFPIQPNGWIRGFVDGDAKAPYVCCRDIGLFTRAVLRNPEKYAGKSIKLIGDCIGGDEIADIVTELRTKAGSDTQTFRYYTVPRLVLRLFAHEFYLMRVYFETFGRDPVEQAKARQEIADLKKIVPEWSSVRDHLEREGWATRELISAEEKKQLELRQKIAVVSLGVAAAGVAIAFAARRS